MMNKPNNVWHQKSLSEVVDLNPRLDKSAYRDDLEVSFVPMAAVEAGSGRMEVSQTKHFATVKKGYTPFREGDVLFAKITPCMENGKMAVVPKLTNDLGFGSTEFHVLRPHEGIHPRYVYYFVSSQGFRREAAHRMTGAVGQKRVPQSFLEEASIPVPLFDDQQLIVAEIEKQFSRLDEAVASLKRIKANLRRYKAAVLKAAVEGKLTEDWRKQHPDVESARKLLERILTERRARWSGRRGYKEPKGPDTDALPSPPRGWEWATAEQLTDETRAITYGVIKLGPHKPDGIPVLRSSDVRSLYLDMREVKRVAPEIAGQFKRTFLKGNEVLVTVRGTLGGVVVAPQQCAGFNISREVAMLALIDETIAKAIAIFIASGPVQRWLMQRTKGIAYTGINIETLKELPLPLPSVAEQSQIVAEVERRLSVIEELEATVEANLTRADRLRQSILGNAFAGKLVCTNTNQSDKRSTDIQMAKSLQ